MAFETLKDIWWQVSERWPRGENWKGKLDEPAQVLSIGSVVGGSTAANEPWQAGLRGLSSIIVSKRQGVSSPLNVNVVFHVPGHLLQREFEGVRTGIYSRKHRLLMVQVALPQELPSDVWSDLLRRMSAAIDEAERWAQKKGVAENLDSLHDLAKRLSAPPS